MKCYAEQQNLIESTEGNSGLRPFCIATSVGFFIGDKMKQIPLTQGQFAIVDDENYKWLSKFKWYACWNKHTKSFYAVRNSKRENGKKYPIRMACEIVGLDKGDKHQADHINHITLDNQISNLRVVTRSQNQWNQKNPKGYCFHKASKKYLAHIRLNGRQIYLGLFHTTKKAHNAYLKAKKVYHKFEGE